MNNTPSNRNNNNNYDFETEQLKRTNTSNPYARSYDEDNREPYHRRYEPQKEYRKVRKQPFPLQFNWGALLFILMIVAVIFFSMRQIGKNPAKKEENIPKPPVFADDTVEKVDELSDNTDTDSALPAEEQAPAYDTITVSNDTIDEGLWILVNAEYPYEDADAVKTVNIFDHRTAPIKVAESGISLKKEAFSALEKMVNALQQATGCDDVIINSGYRTVEDQQDIYDYYLEVKGEDYVRTYVANPKCSEHHTGLACDLSFYLDNGTSEPIDEHEHGEWLTNHCTDYGFVVRYPESKSSITGISYEPWHFRYVGFANAHAMAELGVCMEEYIALLADYTVETELLFVDTNGSLFRVTPDNLPQKKGAIIYYVPLEDDADETKIPLILGKDCNYEISGTNTDGFIVTITID